MISASYARAPVTLTFAYPPPALFAPLGLVPYVPAAITWSAIGFCLYLAAVGAIIPRFLRSGSGCGGSNRVVGGFHNANRFFHGLPDRRLFGPVRTTEGSGGYSAGHLIFKPHFGILFPVVLIAARQWQILANAIVAATP